MKEVTQRAVHREAVHLSLINMLCGGGGGGSVCGGGGRPVAATALLLYCEVRDRGAATLHSYL